MSDIKTDVREIDCEVGRLVELARRLQHTGVQNTITLFDTKGHYKPFKAIF